jgi:hypothetical protein
MFRPGAGKYPKLKGKAGEIKHFTPVLLRVWEEGMNVTDPMQVSIKVALESSAGMDAILDDHPTDPALPHAKAVEFLRLAVEHVQVVASLANYNDMFVFNITLKCHYMIHAAILARHYNPRLGWCFMGEDFMKRVKNVAASCTRGMGAKMVTRKMLIKITRALHYSLSGKAKQ